MSVLSRRYSTLREIDFKNRLLKYGHCYDGKFSMSEDNGTAMEFLMKFGENNAPFSKPKPNAGTEQNMFDYIVAAIVNYENALEAEIKRIKSGKRRQ